MDMENNIQWEWESEEKDDGETKVCGGRLELGQAMISYNFFSVIRA